MEFVNARNEGKMQIKPNPYLRPWREAPYLFDQKFNNSYEFERAI